MTDVAPRFRVRETAEFPIPGPATDLTVTAAVDAAKEWAQRNPPRGQAAGSITISIGPDPHGPSGDLILSVELRDESYPHRPHIAAATVRDGSGPFPDALTPGEQVHRADAVHPTGDKAGPTRARDA